MLGTGHVTGYFLGREDALESIHDALGHIASENTTAPGSTFMFAVGDGNHSLASAKAVWEEYKASHPAKKKHPARYALVEIVNIYDEGLTFEPIHRVLFNVDAAELTQFVAERLNGKKNIVSTQAELIKRVETSESTFGFTYTANGVPVYLLIDAQLKELGVSALQPILDEYLAEHKDASIDYIHGNEVIRLAQKKGAVSILLPPIAKESFFSTIAQKGVLPRKSFSMGEASEKRFYFECRKLF
jgi:uncharacterized protein (DUF1015 family)